MAELVKMYDYLMSEYEKYLWDKSEEMFAYAKSCYIIAQAYLKKIKEYC